MAEVKGVGPKTCEPRVMILPNGNKKLLFENCTEVTLFPNGDKDIIYPDGAKDHEINPRDFSTFIKDKIDFFKDMANGNEDRKVKYIIAPKAQQLNFNQ